jgi:threonine/homoserine/homoserine lactone efflux protein
VVNVLNPKTARLFFPRVPAPVRRPTRWCRLAWQILVLGLLFACLGSSPTGPGRSSRARSATGCGGNTRYLGIQRIVSGSVFVTLGAVAALSAPVQDPVAARRRRNRITAAQASRDDEGRPRR